MDRTIRTIIVLAFLTLAGCNKQDLGNNDKGTNNLYEAQLLGLSINKPASWDFITSEESKAMLSSTKLEDKDMEDLVSVFYKPIVAIVKERWQLPIPSVSITVNPDEDSPNISPVEVLQGLSKMGYSSFKDYSIINKPEEIEIDGHKAAYMKAHYTSEIWGDTKLYPTSYETWIVPRQGYFFMIGAVSSQSEDQTTRSEIVSIIKSIKLK